MDIAFPRITYYTNPYTQFSTILTMSYNCVYCDAYMSVSLRQIAFTTYGHCHVCDRNINVELLLLNQQQQQIYVVQQQQQPQYVMTQPVIVNQSAPIVLLTQSAQPVVNVKKNHSPTFNLSGYGKQAACSHCSYNYSKYGYCPCGAV